MTRWRDVAVATVLALLGNEAAPAGAGPVKNPLEVSWQRRSEEIDALLQQAQWEKAEKRTARLVDDMAGHIIAGGTGWLARAAAFRAMAVAGQGRVDEGCWFWRVGSQLSRDLAKVDLASYVDAGRILAECDRTTAGADVVAMVPVNWRFAAYVEPPKKLKAPQPEFPSARLGLSHPVTVVVGFIIGKDGIPRYPKVLQAAGEFSMVYSVLEAFQKWRFEPARLLEGQPVAAYYNVTVNFGSREHLADSDGD